MQLTTETARCNRCLQAKLIGSEIQWDMRFKPPQPRSLCMTCREMRREEQKRASNTKLAHKYRANRKQKINQIRHNLALTLIEADVSPVLAHHIPDRALFRYARNLVS